LKGLRAKHEDNLARQSIERLAEHAARDETFKKAPKAKAKADGQKELI
jgi:hypothetical protein